MVIYLHIGEASRLELLPELLRVDKTNFPEFALYQKETDDGLIKALKHAGLKEEEKGK